MDFENDQPKAILSFSRYAPLRITPFQLVGTRASREPGATAEHTEFSAATEATPPPGVKLGVSGVMQAGSGMRRRDGGARVVATGPFSLRLSCGAG